MAIKGIIQPDNYAIADLEKIKNETIVFLNGILYGMKKYYDEKNNGGLIGIDVNITAHKD